MLGGIKIGICGCDFDIGRDRIVYFVAVSVGCVFVWVLYLEESRREEGLEGVC